MEYVRTVLITAVIDTNKTAYRTTVHDLPALVAWWNERAEDLRLPTYTLSSPPEGA
jgi:4-alpha-glucanotransferase